MSEEESNHLHRRQSRPETYSKPNLSVLDSRMHDLTFTTNRTGVPPSSPPGVNALEPNTEPHHAQKEVLRDLTAPKGTDGKVGSPQKSARKRPNQAQRRQMSAQLQSAINPPTPLRSPPNQFARNANGPHAHEHQSKPPAHSFLPPSQGISPPIYSGPHHLNNSTAPLPQPFVDHPSLSQPSTVYQAQPYDSVRSSKPRSSGFVPRHVFPGYQGTFRQHTDYGLYNPKNEEVSRQIVYLDTLCKTVASDAEITKSEIEEKEAFRLRIESICCKAISDFEATGRGLDEQHPASTIQLFCFGSLSSGLALKNSDMDLALMSSGSVPPVNSSDSPIPRIIEKALLEDGMGARLLTRTRVPILKLCEKPSEALRRGLLEERERWENSVLNSNSSQESTAHAQDRTPVVNPHEPVDKESDLHLRQMEGKGLWAYYNAARTLLRKEGGRDITAANWSEFSMTEYHVLERVWRLFVEGLADSALKHRIQKLPTFSQPPRDGRPLPPRSLAGVYEEIEGETIISAIEARVIKELNDADEHSISDIVSHWRNIQHQYPQSIDPARYSMELHGAVDRFKRIPSIRLALLEQEQSETATQYHHRTANIVASIRPLHIHALTALERAAVVGHYTTGIRNINIKDFVTAWVASLPESDPPLHFVASAHKVFELLHAFQVGLDKGAYPTVVCEDVQAYIKYLQEAMQSGTAAHGSDLPMLRPTSGDNRALVERIATLAFPRPLSTLQLNDKYKDRLEFPKSGVGVQCDINFTLNLAFHNTLLLRCYCLCDERVRTLILFVKRWAKVRGINSGYRGTLCSYGYALMVLHYLINIVRPYVCPNLQSWRGPSTRDVSDATPPYVGATSGLDGYDTTFWRDESEISRRARNNELNTNTDSVGCLLRGFFEYYAHTGPMSMAQRRGFDWGRDVVSIRTPGGLLTKESKGWTGARTVLEACGSRNIEDGLSSKGATNSRHSNPNAPSQFKEVRHRYLFALEDPFELNHNVARTVTHNGIVAIRDEFRRAWGIIRGTGQNGSTDHLMDEVNMDAHIGDTSQRGGSELNEPASLRELLRELHGIDCIGP